MKNLKIGVSVLALFGLIAMSGCKDNHTCTCFWKAGKVDTVVVTEYPNSTRKTAEEGCAASLDEITQTWTGVSCYVEP